MIVPSLPNLADKCYLFCANSPQKKGTILAPDPATVEAKGWTGRIIALTAFLVAAVGLMDAFISLANKTPSFSCSFGISLPWCNTPKESVQTRVLLNIVRASRSLPLEGSVAGSIFQRGMLTPTSPKDLALLLGSYPRELVFYTITNSIKLIGTNKSTKAPLIYHLRNDPADDQYDGIAPNDNCQHLIKAKSSLGSAIYNDDDVCNFSKFDNFLELAMVLGLTAQLVNSTGHVCFDPTLALPKFKYAVLQLSNLCNGPVKSGSKYPFDFSDVVFSDVEFEYRSTNAIYGFLGKLLRDNTAFRVPSFFIAPDSQSTLFLNVARGESRDCLVFANFEKQSYCVPQTGGNNTLMLFSILEKLRDLSIPGRDEKS